MITPKVVHNPFNQTDLNFNKMAQSFTTAQSFQGKSPDHKLTSLPFHSPHKQTYDAFSSSPYHKRISNNYWRGGNSEEGNSNNGEVYQGKSSKQEKQNLDQLYEALYQFYQSEKLNQQLQESYSKHQNKIKDEILQNKRAQVSDDLKKFLFQQMQEKEHRRHRESQEEFQYTQENKFRFNTLDPSLVSVFPKISETPKVLQSMQQKTKQINYKNDLEEQMKLNLDLKNMERQKDIEEFNRNVSYQYSRLDNIKRKQDDQRRNLENQAKKEWEATLKAQEISNQIKKGADRLQYEIIHGKYGAGSNSLNRTQQLGSIVKIDNQSDNNNDALSEISSMNKSSSRFQYRKNQNSCNFFMGTTGYNKTPRSMYQETFKTPNSRMLNPKRTQDHSLEKLEQVDEEKNQLNTPQVEPQTYAREEVIEEEDQGNQPQQNITFDNIKQQKEQSIIQEDLNEDRNSIFEIQNSQQQNPEQNEEETGSKFKEDIKSLYTVTTKSHRSRMRQQAYTGGKLHSQYKLSQQNLEQLNSSSQNDQKISLTMRSINHPKSHYRVLSETASTVSSKVVQEKIKKYTDQVIPPSLVQQEMNLNSLQYDHLKRFIKQLEEDAITAKRIAKEARLQNKQYDQRVNSEQKHNENIKRNFRKNILQQIKDKGIVEKETKEIDIAKPHIEGNKGYPPRPEPTPEEAELMKKEKQIINKVTFEGQMKEKQLMNKTMAFFEKSEYNKQANDQIAQVDQREEQLKTKSEQQKQEMNETWQKTQKLKELKLKIQNELGLAVNDDKLLQMMKFKLANQDVSPNNHDFLASFTGANNQLFQRKRLQTTTGHLMNQINTPQNQTYSNRSESFKQANFNMKRQQQNNEQNEFVENKLRQFQERIQDRIDETMSHFELKKKSHSIMSNRTDQKINNGEMNRGSQVIQVNKAFDIDGNKSKEQKYPWESRHISKQQLNNMINQNNL